MHVMELDPVLVGFLEATPSLSGSLLRIPSLHGWNLMGEENR